MGDLLSKDVDNNCLNKNENEAITKQDKDNDNKPNKNKEKGFFDDMFMCCGSRNLNSDYEDDIMKKNENKIKKKLELMKKEKAERDKNKNGNSNNNEDSIYLDEKEKSFNKKSNIKNMNANNEEKSVLDSDINKINDLNAENDGNLNSENANIITDQNDEKELQFDENDVFTYLKNHFKQLLLINEKIIHDNNIQLIPDEFIEISEKEIFDYKLSSLLTLIDQFLNDENFVDLYKKPKDNIYCRYNKNGTYFSNQFCIGFHTYLMDISTLKNIDLEKIKLLWSNPDLIKTWDKNIKDLEYIDRFKYNQNENIENSFYIIRKHFFSPIFFISERDKLEKVSVFNLKNNKGEKTWFHFSTSLNTVNPVKEDLNKVENDYLNKTEINKSNSENYALNDKNEIIFENIDSKYKISEEIVRISVIFSLFNYHIIEINDGIHIKDNNQSNEDNNDSCLKKRFILFSGFVQLDPKISLPEWIYNLTIPSKSKEWYSSFYNALKTFNDKHY